MGVTLKLLACLLPSYSLLQANILLFHYTLHPSPHPSFILYAHPSCWANMVCVDRLIIWLVSKNVGTEVCVHTHTHTQ